jgi:hypothetical protein
MYIHIDARGASNEHPLGADPHFLGKYCSGNRDMILEWRLERYADDLQSVGCDREFILGHTLYEACEWYPNDHARCAALVAMIDARFQ